MKKKKRRKKSFTHTRIQHKSYLFPKIDGKKYEDENNDEKQNKFIKIIKKHTCHDDGVFICLAFELQVIFYSTLVVFPIRKIKVKTWS